MMIRDELKKFRENKRYYFYWRNGLSTNVRDYSKINEEEYIEKYCQGSIVKFNNSTFAEQ